MYLDTLDNYLLHPLKFGTCLELQQESLTVYTHLNFAGVFTVTMMTIYTPIQNCGSVSKNTMNLALYTTQNLWL